MQAPSIVVAQPPQPPQPALAARRRKSAALAAATSLALAGCAGMDLAEVASGFGIKKAEPGAKSGFSFTPDNKPPAVAAKSMIGSELDGLLKKHPITSSQRPETWPRVAITVTGVAPAILKTVGFGDNASLGAHDCATYNVKVWTSAKDSRSHDHLRLCYGELYQRMQRVPMVAVPVWGRRGFWPDERNTGSVRNDGPVPPADHFPTDPALQNLWLDPYKNTIFFAGGALHVLGYNWNDVLDKRVWFVSVPGG